LKACPICDQCQNRSRGQDNQVGHVQVREASGQSAADCGRDSPRTHAKIGKGAQRGGQGFQFQEYAQQGRGERGPQRRNDVTREAASGLGQGQNSCQGQR